MPLWRYLKSTINLIMGYLHASIFSVSACKCRLKTTEIKETLKTELENVGLESLNFTTSTPLS